MSSYEGQTRRIDPPSEICPLIQDLLPFYLERDVAPASRALIERHLPTCPQCSSFLAGGRSVRLHLTRAQPAPAGPAWNGERVHQTIAQGRRQLLLIALGVAAVLLLLAISGLSLGGLTRSEPAIAGQPDMMPTVVPPSGHGFGGVQHSEPAPTATPAPARP
jgi:hypothetical protein